MEEWLEEMLRIAHCEGSKEQVFDRVLQSGQRLGFEYCAYGLRRMVTPVSPDVFMASNYPAAWRMRYASHGYLAKDPTILHGQRSQAPIVWSDSAFVSVPHLWEDARSFGLRVGWAQSSLDAPSLGGMLTLCRSSENISETELRCNGRRMQLLACVAHQRLSRALYAAFVNANRVELTAREVEVLRWTAEGKSSQDVADKLIVSKATIDFHIKNAVAKLRVPNKTAATVRAFILGILQ